MDILRLGKDTDPDVQWQQHGVYVQTTTIRRQRRQPELTARKVVASKLVEEVGYFFGDVAQLVVLAKPYLVCAYHLLPPQRPPTNGVTLSSKMVGNFMLQLSTVPDIEADAKTAALQGLSGTQGHCPAPDPPTTCPLAERIVKRHQHHEFLVTSHLLKSLHRV